MTAQELIKQGYRRTSSKYGILSRVDRPDWKEVMAKHHASWDMVEGMEWVTKLGSGAADYYRRCLSKDNITVPKSISKDIPTSCCDSTGYIAIAGTGHKENK